MVPKEGPKTIFKIRSMNPFIYSINGTLRTLRQKGKRVAFDSLFSSTAFADDSTITDKLVAMASVGYDILLPFELLQKSFEPEY